MVRMGVVVVALASLAAFPACADAAMVSPKGGEVRIGTGHGFQQINAPTEVAAGAQVLVGQNGAASIAYSDNCVVSAPAAAVTVVESQVPCAGLPQPSYLGFAQSTEEGVAAVSRPVGPIGPLAFTPKVDAPENVDNPQKTQAPSSSKPSKSKSPAIVRNKPPEDNRELLVVGGIALGAGALAAILLSQGDDPASP